MKLSVSAIIYPWWTATHNLGERKHSKSLKHGLCQLDSGDNNGFILTRVLAEECGTKYQSEEEHDSGILTVFGPNCIYCDKIATSGIFFLFLRAVIFGHQKRLESLNFWNF